MKLSIIIPVYNVEQYIERCLQSCLQQPNVTADDYELVIVNDGTKDNSMVIVERMVRDHTNVTIINQHNQGLSMARNAGLREPRATMYGLSTLTIGLPRTVWTESSSAWERRKPTPCNCNTETCILTTLPATNTMPR